MFLKRRIIFFVFRWKRRSTSRRGIDWRRAGSSWLLPVSYTHLDVYKRQVLEEIKKQGKNLIGTKRDEFVKQNLLSDEFIEMMQKNKKPFDLLMSYYQCAIMEIETKFRVLNQDVYKRQEYR